MERKYAIYIVPSDSDFDKTETGYQEVKDCAINYYISDNLQNLLQLLVGGLNDDSISDQDWIFVTDEVNGIILYS